jgi:hypothetical protein
MLHSGAARCEEYLNIASPDLNLITAHIAFGPLMF